MVAVSQERVPIAYEKCSEWKNLTSRRWEEPLYCLDQSKEFRVRRTTVRHRNRIPEEGSAISYLVAIEDVGVRTILRGKDDLLYSELCTIYGIQSQVLEVIRKRRSI
jgi:hypothetical protein